MTKTQVSKLEAILSRVEKLQKEVEDSSLAYRIGCGKRELLTALREAEQAMQKRRLA